MRATLRWIRCLCVLPITLAAAGEPAWKLYLNGRFKYGICFPDFMTPLREADNGDGRSIAAKDGGTITVWGAYNVINNTVQAELAQRVEGLTKEGGTITYRAAGQDRFTLSGRKGDKHFYTKTIWDARKQVEAFKSFELRYPRALAAKYGPIAARLSSCFKNTTLN